MLVIRKSINHSVHFASFPVLKKCKVINNQFNIFDIFNTDFGVVYIS